MVIILVLTELDFLFVKPDVETTRCILVTYNIKVVYQHIGKYVSKYIVSFHGCKVNPLCLIIRNSNWEYPLTTKDQLLQAER